jgi:hypothetical protein
MHTSDTQDCHVSLLHCFSLLLLTLASPLRVRYYPPEFWDQKNFNDKSNLNAYRGEAWRNRGAQVNSKLLTQGRNVIRFETPFDIVCLGCNETIHKGVRFNADKRNYGKYFTTTIWEFELKCHLCDNKMFVRTDPENTT